MIAYLIKSTVCLGLLLLVYFLFLEKEKMHRFNRWYLLCSIVFDCIVPLISFTITAETPTVLQGNFIEPIFIVTPPESVPAISAIQPTAKTDWFIPASAFLYGSVCFILLVRFGRNLFRLLRSAAGNRIVHYKGAKLVLLPGATASYSFLNYIFISEEDYSSQTLQDDIIRHELTHVKQKHSWDVIFIELLQVVFWFNPLLILYKKVIQLNHEFLADESVVKQGSDVHAYQYLLLDKAMLGNQLILSSPLNFSVTKKRLVMMTKNYNKRSARVKKVLMLPVFVAVVLVFSTRQIIAQEKKEAAKTTQPQNLTQERPPRLLPWDVPVTSEEGVPEAQITEFNTLVEQTITKPAADNKYRSSFHGSTSDRNRMFAIYKAMNLAQRISVKVGFEKRSSPLKKEIPTEMQLEKWKNPSDYGVWINDKKVDNSELNKYKAKDFSQYFASRLDYTKEMKENVMKTFGLKTMYKVQLDLMTNQYYEDYYKKVMASPEYPMFYRDKGWNNKQKKEIQVRRVISE